MLNAMIVLRCDDGLGGEQCVRQDGKMNISPSLTLGVIICVISTGLRSMVGGASCGSST